MMISKIQKLGLLKSKIIDETVDLELIQYLERLLSIQLPKELSGLFRNAEWINNEYSDVFLGYEVLSETELNQQGKSDNEPFSFYACFDGEDLCIDSETSDDLAADEMVSAKRFFPIAFSQGDYLAIDLGVNAYGRLALIEGYNVFYIAPNIKGHIEDLERGLSDELYILDDDEIVFPSLWSQRVAVLKGLLEMDEFGEVTEVG